jgi:voltage-gated potassium channel
MFVYRTTGAFPVLAKVEKFGLIPSSLEKTDIRMEKKQLRARKRLLIRLETWLEGPMIVLGFIWLVLLMVELIWGSNATLEYIGLSIWIVFIADFFLKLTLAPQKIRFLKRNWLTAISLAIPALRIFRTFRLIRLLRGLRGIRLVRIVASLNRGMKSLGATMKRRAFGYVLLLTIVVTFGGAAGMYGLEHPNPGFESFGMALWWTAMRVITAGSDFWPATSEGRSLAFLLSLFGYAIFGYVTATLATFFIGVDAEEKDAPLAGARDVMALQEEIKMLTAEIKDLHGKIDLALKRDPAN